MGVFSTCVQAYVSTDTHIQHTQIYKQIALYNRIVYI